MFDDPRKELKTLEQELLAAEEVPEGAMLDEAEFEALYNEILAEYGPQEEQAPAEPPVRNFANGYGKYAAARPAPRPAPVTAPAPEPEPRKKRHAGLGFIIFLEILALVAVLGFWALYLLG